MDKNNSNLSLLPKEEHEVHRYHKMIEGEDSILTKAPLKDIASYLGIAPQSLSRIRKKYFEEKRKLT